MTVEEIKEKLHQLKELEDDYDGFAKIFNNYILEEDKSEINVGYFAEEMIKTLEKMIKLVKVFRGNNISKEEMKSYNKIRNIDKPADKKQLLKEIKERKEEYAGYLAIFIYIIEDDNSEINAIYTAGEMIKTLKKMKELIEVFRGQEVFEENNGKSNDLKDNIIER